MLYVKCILAGIGVMFAAWIISICGYYLFWVRPELSKVPPGTGVGVDVRLFLTPVFLLIGVIGFVAGFLWKYRVAASR